MHKRLFSFALPVLALAAALAPLVAAASEDVAMFGGTPSRNMISDETGLPGSWDLSTGKNVLWRQPLGTQSYGGPVVSGGKIFVGTNNEGRRNPKLDGDRGNVMAFDAMTGEFLWQSAHAKLSAGRVHDWPLQGVCSAPYVEGNRLYYVSNRAEVIAADTEGFRDGENDGPVTDEVNSSEIDEDVIWRLDMIDELTVFPHNLAVGSALAVGDLLFFVTGNGVDEGHVNITSVRAPSFIAVNKNTGEVAWESDLPGENILHGSWSNPAYAEIGGKPQVVFPGGDGWLYALGPEDGSLIWKFDANPKESVWELGGSGTRNNIISTPVIYKDRVYIGVGQDPEHGEAPAHFWVIDATGSGDITATGVVWSRSGSDFNRTMSTAAIADGIVYIADLSGFLYALDAETGEHLWTYDAFAAIWGSAFVADGKVYLGDEDGDVVVIKAGRGSDGEAEVLEEFNLGSSVYTTPLAKNGVLYIASRNKLFAFKEGAQEKTPPGEEPAP
ncbi:MAG: PQQ-binding-like beta-propeller repeat protein [Thermoanaerobaculia bacterium]